MKGESRVHKEMKCLLLCLGVVRDINCGEGSVVARSTILQMVLFYKEIVLCFRDSKNLVQDDDHFDSNFLIYQ